MSKFNFIYILYCRPFESRGSNNNEAFNELCILSCSYTLFMFTDYNLNFEVREIAGFVLIGLILLNFIVNLTVQLMELFINSKLIFRLLN